MTNILNYLVVEINCRIRECKAALEVEEKTKEVATLQGKISGFKKLISWLCAEFNLDQSFVDDCGEKVVNLDKYTLLQLDSLCDEINLLEKSTGWEEMQKRINNNTEHLKHFLITDAENSRDLYLSQATKGATDMCIDVFAAIMRMREKRSRELNFDEGGDGDPLFDEGAA